jgi:hypothetical protein
MMRLKGFGGSWLRKKKVFFGHLEENGLERGFRVEVEPKVEGLGSQRLGVNMGWEEGLRL